MEKGTDACPLFGGGDLSRLRRFGFRDPQVRQYLGVRLIVRQHVVAGAAVLCDDGAAFRGVIGIVAAPAAGEVRVPDIVGILAPGDVHVGETCVGVHGEHVV